MLDYWYLTPVSLVAATVAMTTGIGGAVFFSPLFMLVLRLPPSVAIAAALLTQLFGFLSGTFAYARLGLIDHGLARRLLLVAAPAALAGSLAAGLLQGPLLRRLFGVVAILIAARVWRSRRQRPAGKDGEALAVGDERRLVDASGQAYRYRVGPTGTSLALSGVGAGLLGMLSVGLAELLQYHFIARCRVPSPVAVATTICVVVVSVAVAVTGHLGSLAVRGDTATLAQCSRSRSSPCRACSRAVSWDPVSRPGSRPVS